MVKKSSKKTQRNYKSIFIGMLIGGICSLIASFVLSVEAVHLAKNPNAELSCSLNAVVNCATVALHPSAEMFGFPNSFLGLMAESVVITVAIAGLAGIRFPRKFMFAAQIGYTLGLIFALYLFYTSYVVIGSLCPWCLLVTATTILVWFSMTKYNILERNLFLSEKAYSRLDKIIAKGYDNLIMASLFVLIIALIFGKYGDSLFM